MGHGSNKGRNSGPPEIQDALETEVYDPHAECGVLSFRPKCLQVFNDMKVFTVVISCYSLFGTINFSYYSAVVYQIEKAYGLSSSTAGFLKNVDNIGYMLTVLCAGHFCRYTNKPRMFFFAALFSASAIFLFAIPHFIYPPNTGIKDYIPEVPGNVSLPVPKSDHQKYLCTDKDKSTAYEAVCNKLDGVRAVNIGALAIFLTSELLQGMGNSPKYSLSLTYIDDNAKDNSPKFFSLMFAMRAFGPLIGFSMGAWSTSMYVDMTEQDFDSKDPRWIGCWWIGFIICAACSGFWAFPVACFPAKLKPKKKSTKNLKELKPLNKEEEERKMSVDIQKSEEDVGIASQIKDLPAALLRIFSIPVYIILVIATCMEIQMMGFATFTPKYLQIYFGVSPSVASILTGILITASFALGPIISGQIVARCKNLTPAWSLKFMVILGMASGACFFIVSFLSCGPETWATDMTADDLRLTEPCNSNCSCSEEVFLPVCGSNQVNYFSPCHAGCFSPPTILNGSTAEVYHNCSCIPTGVATKGKCERDCTSFIPYLVLVAIAKFIASMDFVPKTICIMRLAGSRDKTLAISAFTAIILVAGFPAPYFFGLVIDSTCVIFQSICGQHGACLQYDIERFRVGIHTFGVGIKFASTILYLIGWYVAKRLEKRDLKKLKQTQEVDEKNVSETLLDRNQNLSENNHQ